MKYLTKKQCAHKLLTECRLKVYFPQGQYKQSMGSNRIYHAERNKLLRESVEYQTKFLNRYNPIDAERWYYLLHGINKYLKPKCGYCENPVEFKSLYDGYREYCSVQCQTKDPLRNKKRKKTYLKKYGVEFFNNREKAKETCLEKYGVDNPSKSDEIHDKKKRTCLKNHGVEYALQSDKIKENQKKTKWSF